MRVLIASAYAPFGRTGTTKIVDELHRELKTRGYDSETVLLPLLPLWDLLPEQTLAFRLLDLAEAAGNRIDRLIVLESPSHALRHPDKVVWFQHHHRPAYQLWGTPSGGMPMDVIGVHYRAMMHRSDTAYLKECRSIFAATVAESDRLKKYNDIGVTRILYPPLPSAHPFRPSRQTGDYFLQSCPRDGKESDESFLRAIPHTPGKIKLMIVGEDPASLESLRVLSGELGVSGRVSFVGDISDGRRAELLASCCGYLDSGDGSDPYGWAALEAFHTGKPVVTARDPDSPLEFARNGETGFVCDPSPESIADAMVRLWSRPSVARAMGLHALGMIGELKINWDHVVENLIA